MSGSGKTAAIYSPEGVSSLRNASSSLNRSGLRQGLSHFKQIQLNHAWDILSPPCPLPSRPAKPKLPGMRLTSA